jgi:Ran GTPase-activating protein (RanGAP) involved in mRNA processing and transport
VDEDVEAKIRALSEMATGAVSPSYSELRSAFERNEEDEEDEEDDDEEDEDEEDLPEVAEAIPEPVSPPRKLRVRAAPSHTARRLKEAFARLDLLEACVADLRDSLLAVASSINEES